MCRWRATRARFESARQAIVGMSIGRAILDLPVDESGSILNHWLSHAAELAQYAGLDSLPVQVLVSRNTPEPVSAAPRYAGSYRVMRDQSEYRGTGGVLRDLAADYEDSDDWDILAETKESRTTPE